MPMPRVSEELLAEVTRRLVAELDPEAIYLFGSQAWGEPEADSDVDLLVVVGETNESETAIATRGHAALRGLGLSFDILVERLERFEFIRDAPASLEFKVCAEGRVLHERGPAAVRAGVAGGL